MPARNVCGSAQKARHLDPQLIEYSRRPAGLYGRADQSAEAAREYQLALQAAPNDTGCSNGFSYFQLRRGDLAGSEQSLREPGRLAHLLLELPDRSIRELPCNDAPQLVYLPQADLV